MTLVGVSNGHPKIDMENKLKCSCVHVQSISLDELVVNGKSPEQKVVTELLS